MRLEHIPLFLGLLFVVAGVALIADALLREQPLMMTDRRKRSRAPRHRGGQVAIGVGTLFVAAALFGRDGWRYGTVAVLLGVVAFATGVWLNWGYVKAFMLGPESPAMTVSRTSRRPMKRRSRVPLDREVPTPAVAGDLVAAAPRLSRSHRAPQSLQARPAGCASASAPSASSASGAFSRTYLSRTCRPLLVFAPRPSSPCAATAASRSAATAR